MVLFYIIKEGFSSQSTIEPNAVVALYTFYIEVKDEFSIEPRYAHKKT